MVAAPTIGAGDLRERVAFEVRTTADDGYGGTISDWAEQISGISARILPGGAGREEVQAARLAGRAPVEITVRWSLATSQITTDWRARNVRTDELYNIRAVENRDERKQFITITAEKGVQT